MTPSRARVPLPSIYSGPLNVSNCAFRNSRGRLRKTKRAALDRIRTALVDEALKVHEERREGDKSIGRFGAELLPKSGRVMTQCNAGALATAGIGTALGVIRMAVEGGYRIEVIVPETRPYLQGSRLTAWELHQDRIPLTLITDNMVGHFLKTGGVGAVVVGADRIARNGDTANKIGTYGIAVIAKENGVPFYVAAPISTIDYSIASGEQIPIEERSQEEVTHLAGVRISADVRAAHPAFDVTPARYISAIITENGVARAPFEESLQKLAYSSLSSLASAWHTASCGKRRSRGQTDGVFSRQLEMVYCRQIQPEEVCYDPAFPRTFLLASFSRFPARQLRPNRTLGRALSVDRNGLFRRLEKTR